MDLTFRRVDKIKGIKTINNLFDEPNIVTVFPLKAFYKTESITAEKTVELAVSVSKKRFKKSPNRNRVKRVLRESYRINKVKILSNIPNHIKLSVMIVYIGKELPKTTEINSKTEELFKKISTRIN